MLRTGVDIIEVHRVDHAIIQYGQRFLERIYTCRELIEANGHTPSLAARFAAKESVAKALGCGIGKVSWLDIEIIRNSQRCPLVRFHGAAIDLAETLGLDIWSLSMSHTHAHATAFVIAMASLDQGRAV